MPFYECTSLLGFKNRIKEKTRVSWNILNFCQSEFHRLGKYVDILFLGILKGVTIFPTVLFSMFQFIQWTNILQITRKNAENIRIELTLSLVYCSVYFQSKRPILPWASWPFCFVYLSCFLWRMAWFLQCERHFFFKKRDYFQKV